jgi:hypothetical protein
MFKICTIYKDVYPLLERKVYRILDENELSYQVVDETGKKSWWSKSRFENRF